MKESMQNTETMKEGYCEPDGQNSKIIVIFGLPGCGKSTFAQELSVAINASLISSHLVRDEFLLRGNYTDRVKEKVYTEMLNMATAALKHGGSVILDGTYYKEGLRRKVISKARELHLIPYFIEIKADEDVVHDRIKARSIEGDADYGVYLKIREQFEPMCDYHLIMHSDIQTTEEMMTEALLFIGIYHEVTEN